MIFKQIALLQNDVRGSCSKSVAHLAYALAAMLGYLVLGGLGAFTACECNFDRGALCQLQACEDMLWIEPAWDDLPLQEQQGVS